MVYREDDQIGTLKAKSREAISLAMESRWDEAASANRELLELSPDDIDASNRLGKALLELGDLDGSREAFERSLRIDPTNTIARKNVDRLSHAGAVRAAGTGSPLAPKMFIGDTGKSAQVLLLGCATGPDRAYPSPGVPIVLKRESPDLVALDHDARFIGIVPPKLGRRLACLMDAGNEYTGAISGSTPASVRVVLRESYQHPSQRSKVSFLSASYGSEAPPQPKAAPELIEKTPAAEAPVIAADWAELAVKAPPSRPPASPSAPY